MPENLERKKDLSTHLTVDLENEKSVDAYEDRDVHICGNFSGFTGR